MERMLRENNKRMLKLITKQFSQTAIANREKGTFPSQPETNPKGKISSGSTPDTFRKVNAIITLRSGKEIDNHVEDNLNEKSNTPPTLNTNDSGDFKEDESTITITTIRHLRLLMPLPCRFRNL